MKIAMIETIMRLQALMMLVSFADVAWRVLRILAWSFLPLWTDQAESCLLTKPGLSHTI